MDRFSIVCRMIVGAAIGRPLDCTGGRAMLAPTRIGESVCRDETGTSAKAKVKNAISMLEVAF